MKKDMAESLVSELEKHPALRSTVRENRQYFIDILVSTEVPESTRFYEKVKPNILEVPGLDNDQIHYISLRRVLRNQQAKEYQLPWLKSQIESLASFLGIYDSDVLTRNIRANKELVDMMSASSNDFSLLGKLETLEIVPERVYKSPILVIPDSPDFSKIYLWEHANSLPKERISRLIRA